MEKNLVKPRPLLGERSESCRSCVPKYYKRNFVKCLKLKRGEERDRDREKERGRQAEKRIERERDGVIQKGRENMTRQPLLSTI